MKVTKAKLFWKIGDWSKEIMAIPYTDDIAYDVFVKECYDAGYRQVIITAEVMLSLIQKITMNGFRVSEIQLTENSSTEIQRIRFDGQTADGIAVEGLIQSNGLLGISSEVFEKAAKAISKEVRKCVFGLEC